MSEVNQQATTPKQSWTQKQVYTMSAICVVLGLVFGYFLRGTEGASAHSVPGQTVAQHEQGMPAPTGGGQQMPSLDDMKRMADKAAEPLLAQLKADPKNPQLLIKVGGMYKSAHQFKQAAEYFNKALQLQPKDVALRDEVGADQYYAGDVDAAIATFKEGLKNTQNDPSMLLDLGLIKVRKKDDSKGAVELWQRLLDKNPNLEPEKRAQVEKLIATAKSGKPIAGE